jgi:hypothetical protein
VVCLSVLLPIFDWNSHLAMSPEELGLVRAKRSKDLVCTEQT